MKLGNIFENSVADVFALDHPDIQVSRCQETWTRPEWPRFRATPDFKVLEPDNRFGVLETKFISHWRKKEFEPESDVDDASPEEMVAQLQWQMGFRSDVEFGWIQAVMGNADDESPANRYVKDELLISMLHERAEKFLWYVDNDTPPETNEKDTESLTEYLLKHTKRIDGKVIALDNDAHAMFEKYFSLNEERLQLNRDAKSIKEMQDNLEAKLVSLLGDAKCGRVGPYSVYVDTYKRKGYSVAPIEKEVVKVTKDKIK